MKKILAVLCAAMFAGQAWAETITSGDIVYEVTDDKVEVTGYTGSATTVSIPLYFVVSGKYYTPKSIGDYAFINNTTITKVSISPNVKTIGYRAFYGCTNLKQVEFYDAGSQVSALETIDNYAFSDCSSLTSITIPNSVTRISNNAFDGCSKLTAIKVESENAYYTSENGVLFNKNKTELIRYPIGRIGSSYNIPNSVTSIGYAAFDGCSGLTSVTIPNSVTSIGKGAFYGCSGLTSVTIPNSVTSISNDAFYGCSGLTSVTIPNSVTSIESYVFFNCSGLTSVTIPNSVTSIGDWVFDGCNKLTAINVESGNPYYTSVNGVLFNKDKTALIRYPEGRIGSSYNIPNSVTSIGNYAFNRCTSLTSVTIPNTVTRIGEHVFSRCSGLTSVTIPNSVTSISNDAFNRCTSLTSVTIPNTVTRIGRSAFFECSGLTSISIPNSVTSIGETAFWNCTGLTSIIIPNSVTSIALGAFSGCSSLTSVAIPKSATSIGDYAFNGVKLIINYSSATGCPWGAKSVRYGDGDFIYADAAKTQLLAYTGNGGNVTIPNSVTSIGNSAFEGCSSLTSVTIGNSVTSIGANAFGQCGKLTSISIPASVTSISSNAFELCGNLTTINVNSSNAYYASANGVLFNKSKTTLISFPGGKTGTYTIPNTVTSIDANAFQNCGNLSSVYIPNTVKSIGSSAFTYCTASVYCEVESEPSGWNSYWHYDGGGTVYFGKTITATSSNTSYGTVTGSGTYYHGTSVTLNATPNTGYHFDKWGDGNIDNPRTVTVTETKTYTATFAPNIYNISALYANGTVEGIGNNIITIHQSNSPQSRLPVTILPVGAMETMIIRAR